jgi:hypothetical protein
MDLAMLANNWPTEAYLWLKDLGSFGAGILSLMAGVLAYFAGRIQASATKRAAREQVEATKAAASDQVWAMHQQLSEQRDAAREHDRRSGHALAMALSIEAAHVKMLVQIRYFALSKMKAVNNSDALDHAITTVLFPMPIELNLRNDVNLDSILNPEIGTAARVLIASIDRLNGYVRFSAAIEGFNAISIKELLDLISQAANELQKMAEGELARLRPRPVPALDV